MNDCEQNDPSEWLEDEVPEGYWSRLMDKVAAAPVLEDDGVDIEPAF